MEHSTETRRYLAKVSQVGIVAATLFALLYGALHYFCLRVLYPNALNIQALLFSSWNLLTELTVAVAGIIALAVCGALSLAGRKKPALPVAAWITAGKALLLAAPVGYMQSLCSSIGSWNRNDMGKDFLLVYAVLATIYVGYALGARGIPLNQSLLCQQNKQQGQEQQQQQKKAYALRVLGNTAILLGVMLASVLLFFGWTWGEFGSLFRNVPEGILATLKLLRKAFPVALIVILGYPLLSLIAWRSNASQGKLLSRGSALFMWIALAVAGINTVLSLLYQIELMDYTSATMATATKLMGWQNWLEILSTLASLWALCLLLSHIRGSRIAAWGVRGILAVMILRQFVSVLMDMVTFRFNYSPGGVETYMRWMRIESWVSIILSFLAVAALCILTVGLTRHCRVGKAFWTVPALAAVMALTPLLVSLLWEGVMKDVSLGLAERIRLMVLVAIPGVLSLIRSLVGLLTLARTPAKEAPPPPAAPAGEAPKPRVEDYLFQL